MIFVFDLDDTVVDTDGYSEKYISSFIEEHNWPYKKVKSVVRYAEKKFDWDAETALTWYKEYGDQMMLEFPLKDNAKEVINALYDEGHKIVIATARGNDWHRDPEGVTRQWLDDNGIKYHKAYIGRVDKEKICEEEGADVFLDDDVKITAKVGEYFKHCDKGGFSCLFTTAYNEELEIGEDVVRVRDFVDFKEKIKLFIDDGK